MREPSNRAIAVLVLIVIAASLLIQYHALKQPTTQTITGQVTSDLGTLEFIIDTTGGIRFAVNNISFGRGRINTSGGNTACVLDTNGTNDSSRCINFTANTGGFQLENDGSANASVQLYFSNNATGLLGGNEALNEYRYVVSQNETDSCRNSSGGTSCGAGFNCTVAPIGWSDVNISTPGTTICPKLLFTDESDSLLIDVNITIPYDTLSGAKSSVLTATATTA